MSLASYLQAVDYGLRAISGKKRDEPTVPARCVKADVVRQADRGFSATLLEGWRNNSDALVAGPIPAGEYTTLPVALQPRSLPLRTWVGDSYLASVHPEAHCSWFSMSLNVAGVSTSPIWDPRRYLNARE